MTDENDTEHALRSQANQLAAQLQDLIRKAQEVSEVADVIREKGSSGLSEEQKAKIDQWLSTTDDDS